MSTKSSQVEHSNRRKSSLKASLTKKLSKKKHLTGEGSDKRGWCKVHEMMPHIIQYGYRVGTLSHSTSSTQHSLKDNSESQEEVVQYRGRNRSESTRYDDMAIDDDLKHQAIPFLPVPVAVVCFVLNLLLPGTGSIMSGILGMCIGRPRIVATECRRASACYIMCSVGCMQFFTVPLCLVGWGWSVAWGGLIVHYALQYRGLKNEHKQAAHTIDAVEYLSKEKVMHRSNVNAVIRNNNKSHK